MKTEIIRSRDKNFEEVKHRMFEISDMQEAKKGLTKEEQLEKVFSTILSSMLIQYDMIQYGGMSETELKEKYTRILLREVKARFI